MKADNKRLAAIIIAAGYSSRMHSFKPLLPLGGTTVIERSIDNFLEAGIGDIIVVIGYNADGLKAILDKKGIGWVYNKNYMEGMYSSVCTGVGSLKEDVEGVFIQPVDIPLVKASTLTELREAFFQAGGKIIFPSMNYRRGHPPLIPKVIFKKLLEYKGEGGLKGFLKGHAADAHYIAVEDEGILLDIDTYEDYMVICSKLEADKQDKGK